MSVEVNFVSELLGTVWTRDGLGFAGVLCSLVSQRGRLGLERTAAHVTQEGPLRRVTRLQESPIKKSYTCSQV